MCTRKISINIMQKKDCSYFDQYRHWTFYTMLGWAAAMLLSICIFVPETYRPMSVSIPHIPPPCYK